MYAIIYINKNDMMGYTDLAISGRSMIYIRSIILKKYVYYI